MNIQESDKSIAEFLEWEYKPVYKDIPTSKRWYPDKNYDFYKTLKTSHGLRFHNSWEWLMPVVEKIESLGFEVIIDGFTCIIHKGVGDVDHSGDYFEYEYSNEIEANNKLEATYKAVVNFIQWYKNREV